MECPNCGRVISAYSRRCGSCGKTIPPAQHLLEDSGVVEPYAPTATATSRGAASPRPTRRIASLGDRLIAVMLDSIVFLGASAVISAWSFRRWGFASGAEFHLTTASLLIAGTLSAAIFFAYLWLLEAAFDVTLGKVMVGIRVSSILATSSTRARGPLAASAIRNTLRIVDGIGFYFVGAMVAGCSRLRQRLGDMLAGTVVVDEKFSARITLLAVVLWTAALAGAGWALPRVCAGEVSIHAPRYFSRSVVQFGHTADSAYVRVSRLRIDLQLAPAPPPAGVATVDSPR